MEILADRIPGLLTVYAFGSAGTEFERPGSDVDLAVLAEGRLDPVELWQVAQEVAGAIGRDVDLVDLRESSTVLRARVVSTGTRLFCADTTRCDTWETMAYSAYALLNEERRGILEDIRARGRVHGR